MTELLANAWQGWINFNSAGKLSAALLISLVLLWVYSKRVPQKTFLVYTSVVTAACIIPLTAAALMLYQTKFYDYEWIWSIVPLTAMIAMALTMFLTEYLRGISKGDRRTEIAVFLLVLAGLLFCGDMGVKAWNGAGEKRERQEAAQVLAVAKERMAERHILLWAPEEIMGYARQTDASVELIYGRNMWDEALNAYAYDIYPDEIHDLYLWMEADPEELSEADVFCAEAALRAGVNCVLIPADKPEKTVGYLERLFRAEAERVGEYYLLAVTRTE